MKEYFHFQNNAQEYMSLNISFQPDFEHIFEGETKIPYKIYQPRAGLL